MIPVVKNKTLVYTVSLAVVATISISNYSNYLIDNTAYIRMDISYKRVSSYFNRILSRVETTEGYVQGDMVTMLGEYDYMNNPSPVDTKSDYPTDILREMSGVALENGLLTSGVRDNFITNFIGFKMADIHYSKKTELMNTNIYKNMPNYPEEGCIAQIDGIWVVKLCD